jgi:AcrR family transcriptional regulator
MTGLSKKGAATRAAILKSARQAFTQSGYDVGVREIAKNAGVTAMMIKRYFGSKEQLFEEVVDTVFATSEILTQESMNDSPDLRTLCSNVAVALVEGTAPHATPSDEFLIMLRSANNKQANAVLCEKLEMYFSRPLMKLMPGASTAQRAAIFLSVIASVHIMRQIIGMTALTRAEPGELAKRLEALFSSLGKGSK